MNIASPVFGSTAPLLAAWLTRDSGLVSGFQVFGGYLIALSMMAAWAILQLDRQAFERWGEPRSSGVNA